MNFHVDELIAAFLAQELDENSTNELLQWVNASAANELYFRQKLEAWSAAIDQKDSHRYNKNKAFQQFRKRLLLAKQPIRQSSTHAILRYLSHHKIATYAAMLLIIAGVGGFAYMKGKPGFGFISSTSEIAYVQISVAPGETRKMVLPDSTIVWLNAGSTFKYPENFNSSTREVSLDGEGYFEVVKNANHPFTVSTSKGKIVVMGTTFNVSAYASKPRFVTALLEGRVRVSDLHGKSQDLAPMRKAELVKDALVVSDVTDTDLYKWKEGLISFDNEPISEVLDHLANSFGQKIVIRQLKNPDLLLTGKFRVADGLSYALKILGQSYGLKYVKNTRDDSYIILN
jgi:transmembrane sensor